MALRAAQARARKALVDRAAAQKLPVIRVPKFLDDSALNAIDALGSAHALVHGPPVAARTAWRTQYLNADGLARTKASELLDRLVTLAKDVDDEHFSGNSRECETRCVELHDCGEGAGLDDPTHFDSGSVVTLDVCLREADAGGRFQTLEEDGSTLEHVFERGDALIFPSYKYHGVSRVESGRRRVLVLELWNGEERFCNHRCTVARGDCELLQVGVGTVELEDSAPRPWRRVVQKRPKRPPVAMQHSLLELLHHVGTQPLAQMHNANDRFFCSVAKHPHLIGRRLATDT